MTADDTVTEKKETKKQRGLGRGLEALFGDEEAVPSPAAPQGQQQAPGAPRRTLGPDQLCPGRFQPRQDIDDRSIAELADSIRVHGILQPLIVRPLPGTPGMYEIIAGERRWRAAQKAQLHEIPVAIRDFDDQTALQVGLIENLQREDLNALDEAEGYLRLMNEFGHTQEKLAQAVGKSRSHIANTVRLMGLPQAVRLAVRQGLLTAGHARALITSDDPEALAKKVIEQNLSVRQAEALAAEEAGRPPKTERGAAKGRKAKDTDTIALEKEVSAMLGMKIDIGMKDGGAGTLRVDFKTLDQLDDLLHRLSHFPGRQQSG